MASPSPEVLAEKFELIGSWGLRATAGTGLGTGVFLTLPTASVDYRGLMLRTEGDTGVADQIVVCRKNADDAYEWIEVNDQFQICVTDARTYTDLGAGPSQSASGLAVVDLTDYADVRFTCNVTVGGATGVLKLWFSDTDHTTTNSISLSATGVASTAWEPIPEGARTLNLLGTSAEGGNGSEDPELTNLVAMFRR